MDNLPPLREVIAAHDLRARKSLGQNFLLDLNLTRRIARAAGANDGGVFYEVGPGPGGLTRALLMEGADLVIAIEQDMRCLPVMEEIIAAYPGRLHALFVDAMDVDERAVLRMAGVDDPVRIAANLPYNVGTALLIKWLTSAQWPPFWAGATLMFQKEVAQRITAQPGTEHYGRLSVLTQWRARPKILFDVNRSAFVPPPSVTSAIVRLEPRDEPLAPAQLQALEAVTAVTFGQRRKMLRQSLKPLGGEALAEKAGIDPTARPEDLTIEQFAALARASVDKT